MMLEEDGIRVEWEDIGEGICGDYNPEDPDDHPLLRFSVSILLDGQWEAVEDASYCTQMPVDTPVQSWSVRCSSFFKSTRAHCPITHTIL